MVASVDHHAVVVLMRSYRSLAESGEYALAATEVGKARGMLQALVDGEAKGSDRRRKLGAALEELGAEEQLILGLKAAVSVPRKKSPKTRVTTPAEDPSVWPPPTAVAQRRPSLPAWAQQRKAPPQRGRRSSGGGAMNNDAQVRRQRSSSGDSRNRLDQRQRVVPQQRQRQEKKESATYSEYAKEKGLPDVELIELIEREIVESAVDVSWDDIADLREAKQLLQEAVVLPLWMPEFFKGIRRPWKGVLMFGPPVTGKTLLAKAVAAECKTTFFNVSAATLSSKWRGESEKMVKILFDVARFLAPSTIFFDEIDALAGQRGGANEHEASRRIKTTLLAQMDGVECCKSDDDNKPQWVVVLAATNTPWDLDEAMRRRLEKRIYIPLPTFKGRVALFNINMKDIDVDTDVNLEALAEKTDGYSGADVANVCRDAAMMSVRRLMDRVRAKGLSGTQMHQELVANKDHLHHSALSYQDFLDAISKVHKSVGQSDLQRFQDWKAEFGAA